MRQHSPSSGARQRHLLRATVVILGILFSVLSPGILFSQIQTSSTQTQPALELSRPVRPWEFFDAVGRRAAIFGHENGAFESWIYPLKLFRDFHLVFHYQGRAVPAEDFARTLTVRPESTTILYAHHTFQVRQTIFVPPGEPGAVIELAVDTTEPLQIEAQFQPDMQLMWPAAVGGTYSSWDEKLHGFVFGEESRHYAGVIASPSAAKGSEEFFENQSSSPSSSMLLPPLPKGAAMQRIVIAGSVKGRDAAEQTFRKLSDQAPQLLEQAREYYRDYLARTVSVSLPDAELQSAYDWARVSTIQGLVENPFLGTGLVAGFRTSGLGARPGFAWFFGRDSLWTDLALTSIGDFATTRTALDFITKFQRDDGKMPHEISQAASLVNWAKDYPYEYASADATPLYLIALDDYVRSSGDAAFAREKWESAWQAYQFMRSTYDENGFLKNDQVGHGWVEGGPLLPVKNEFYHAGLGVAALRALARVAKAAGKEDEAEQLKKEFAAKQSLLNQTYWSPQTHAFAFGMGRDGRLAETPTVLSTVPMWFGVTDADKSDQTITRLSASEHATDWGMRILSVHDPRFDPSGYHYGAVWPLFTGWAAVGEYRYHRAAAGYANLRANALLTFAGSLGHVTEVQSGSFNVQLATSSPHQIWSSAMVISPLLRGMLGLGSSATSLNFSPHVPAGWQRFEIDQLPACNGKLKLAYSRTAQAIELRIHNYGAAECSMIFSPAVSPRALVATADMNGKTLKVEIEDHPADRHARVSSAVPNGDSMLRLRVARDFGMELPQALPPLGEASRGLHLISEKWNSARDRLEALFEGQGGREYDVQLYGAGPAKVDGAHLRQTPTGQALHLSFPASAEGTTRQMTVTLSFR